MSSSTTDLQKNTLLVGLANLLSRITGLLRDVAFAAVFGAGLQADAYNAAFRIGSLFRELFAEGSLSSAFIPLYADVEEKEGIHSAFGLANAFLGVLLLAVGVVTVLTYVFAEPLVYLIAAGYDEIPGKVELTATLTRVLSPFVATVSMAAVFMGMLNVRGRFFLPAVAPVLFNILTIGACLGAEVFSDSTGWDPILAVGIAALLGGASQALIQLPSLYRSGFRIRPTLGNHPHLKRLLKFLGPALIAISVVQVNLLIETQLASREGDGPVSWLFYSFKIVHLPLSIVSVAVGVASLAGLSVLAAQQDWDRFRKTLSRALNLNSFLILPSAVGLYLLAEPVVGLFLERGAFLPEDTLQTAAMLQMYCIAVMGIGAHRVLIPVYYTLNDPHTPMWAGLATVLLKLPVALALMGPLGFGIQGLPLSHGVLVTAEVAFLIFWLNRKVPGLMGGLILEHCKTLVAASVMGGAVYGAREQLLSVGEIGFLQLMLLIGLGVAVYFITALALKMGEVQEIASRLLRRRPAGLPPTVPEETVSALQALAATPVGAPQWAEGRLILQGEECRFTLRAEEGKIRASMEAAEASEPSERAIVSLVAVMRVGGGPPSLQGLGLGELKIRAVGAELREEEASGPVIPVSPPEPE